LIGFVVKTNVFVQFRILNINMQHFGRTKTCTKMYWKKGCNQNKMQLRRKYCILNKASFHFTTWKWLWRFEYVVFRWTMTRRRFQKHFCLQVFAWQKHSLHMLTTMLHLVCRLYWDFKLAATFRFNSNIELLNVDCRILF
jgi:hypothetical protein